MPERLQRNYLDYYVHRDICVIRALRKKSWVSKTKLIVAGHSEGAAIASKIASIYSPVTGLIYVSGSPLGRMLSELLMARREETDSSRLAESQFDDWNRICVDPENNISEGDSNRGTFQASWPPPISWITRLKIPALISYGTKDQGAQIANDYLRLEAIRLKKTNFTFNSYIGLEHNFFPIKSNGEVNYDLFGWDKVVADWYVWLKSH